MNSISGPLGVVIVGKVGSGKTSIARNISYRHTFHHVEPGDICRKEMAINESFRKRHSKGISQRNLVNDEEVMELILRKVTPEISEVPINGLVLEGFPRNGYQAICLANLLKKFRIKNRKLGYHNTHVVEIVADDEVCLERIMNDTSRTARTDGGVEATRKSLAFYNEQRDRIFESLMKLGFPCKHISSHGTEKETLNLTMEALGLKISRVA